MRKKTGRGVAIATCLLAAQAAFMAPQVGATNYDHYCEDRDHTQTISKHHSPDYEWMHDTRTGKYVEVKVTINGTFMKMEGVDVDLANANWCVQTRQGPEYGTGRSAYSRAYNDYGYRELIKEIKVYSVTTEDPYDGKRGKRGGKKHRKH